MVFGLTAARVLLSESAALCSLFLLAWTRCRTGTKSGQSRIHDILLKKKGCRVIQTSRSESEVPPSRAFETSSGRLFVFFGSSTAPADHFGDILRTLSAKLRGPAVVMIRSLLRSWRERWESSDLSLPDVSPSSLPPATIMKRANKVIGSSYLLIRNTTWTWRCRSLLQVMHASYSVAVGTQLFWGELDRPHPIPSSLACKRTSKRGSLAKARFSVVAVPSTAPLFFRLTNPEALNLQKRNFCFYRRALCCIGQGHPGWLGSARNCGSGGRMGV